MTAPMLETALAAHHAGLCVLPPREDGTKAPDTNAWKHYQTVLSSRQEIHAWYAAGQRSGIGFVTGAVSGNLELLDFDDVETYETFRELAHAAGLGILVERVEAGYLEASPGGRHWLYRCETITGNTKLARRPAGEGIHVLIETRGEGGYVVAAPSNGRVHPEGGVYRLLRGGVGSIATITPDERAELHRIAASLDRMPKADARDPRTAGAGNGRPGDDYNERGDVLGLLEAHGWTVVFESGGVTHLRRPGKDRGTSATFGLGSGGRLFYPFTTSTAFDAEQPYCPFAVYATLEHGGDFKAASKALRHQGYGEPPDDTANTQRGAGDPRLMVRSLADVQSQPVEWLWQRWLGRGKFHLIGGYAGDGKSTLLASLAAEGSRAGRWPDDTLIARPFRTLFMLGEDAAGDTLKPRLELHNADMSQVFVIDGVLDEQGDERHFNITKHLGLLEATITQYAIDCVVIDPLTTVMAGTDRNAEGDTRDTLTPLVKMAERLNVAIVGVAHVGKSDGVRRAAQKILGATAFHAMARIVWMIAPDGEDRMALGVSKSNLAIKPLSLAWSRDEDGPIVWQGLASQDVEELLTNSPAASPKADAEGFLREYLAGGRKPSKEVIAAAKAQGIAYRTLRRAADALQIDPKKDPSANGQWFWMLPDDHQRRSTGQDAGPENKVPAPPERKMSTPRDSQVDKLDTFPSGKVSNGAESGHLHATTPLFANGHHEDASHIMEGVQLVQPSPSRGGHLPSDENGSSRNGWDNATRVVIG